MKPVGITEGMWHGLGGKLLYIPLLNILVFLYVYIPGQDLGLAIIAITVLIRMALYPSYRNTLRSQRDLQKIQPYIDKIKAEYKDDPQKQSQEVMKVYKEHNVNLFASCLPLIIQLPILLALYRVFVAGLDSSSLQYLYSWFPNPPVDLHTTFLAFTGIPWLEVALTERNIVIAVLAGLAQLWQSWLTAKHHPTPANASPQNAISNKLMLYILPVITFGFSLTLPSALGLYWATATATMALQQLIIYRGFARDEQKVIAVTHHSHES